MPSKRKTPEIEMALIVVKKNKRYGALSIVIDGKSYQYPINRKRVLYLLSSAAESAADMRD